MLVEIKKMNREEVVTCTSLDIAETFEKEHKNVLKDIRELSFPPVQISFLRNLDG